MNVEESQKCISIARAAVKTQDWGKAVRFLEKSMRLHETSEAKHLLDVVKKKLETQE